MSAKCRDCGNPASAEGRLCPSCNAILVRKWRDGMTLQPTREFPGVDIDRIHFKRQRKAT